MKPKKINTSYSLLTIVSLFSLLLIGTCWIYWTGLDGVYLLDDNPNLSSLEYINQSSDKFTDIVRFSTEGTASQLGRTRITTYLCVTDTLRVWNSLAFQIC